MVTVTAATVSNLTEDVADRIEHHIGLGQDMLDLPALERIVAGHLQSWYGVIIDYEQEDDNE